MVSLVDLQSTPVNAAPASFELKGPELRASNSLQLAQGVMCGEMRLAFTFSWARQIVDDFDLVALPRAPGWVLGAVNINGAIVPVVDQTNYFTQSIQPAQSLRGPRPYQHQQ